MVHLLALFDTEAVCKRYCCPTGKKRSRLNAVSLPLEDTYHQKLNHKCFQQKKLRRMKSEVSCTDTNATVCRYSRIKSICIRPTKIWVLSGVSNHHRPHRTVSHRMFQSVFQQFLLWIQAQILLRTQAPHTLKISRGRTRSLTILQIQVSLMSIFYLVQTFKHHNPKQVQPISRHPIAPKLQ